MLTFDRHWANATEQQYIEIPAIGEKLQK